MPYYGKSYSSYKPTGMTGPERRRAAARGMSATDRAYVALRNRSSQPMRSARVAMPTETKYFDVSFSQTVASAADWTGTEVPCTNYIQSDGTTLGAYTDSALIPSAIGAGYGNVNGNKYYLKKLRLKGEITSAIASDQADVPVGATVRFVVIEDTQPQGSQAQGESVFSDMGGATQCNYSFLAMAAGSGGRFRILKDKIFTLNPAVVGTDGANTNSCSRNSQVFKVNLNFAKPRQVMLKANSATPTVASLSNCNIFILAHTTANGASPSITLQGCARAYFQD